MSVSLSLSKWAGLIRPKKALTHDILLKDLCNENRSNRFSIKDTIMPLAMTLIFLGPPILSSGSHTYHQGLSNQIPL